MSGASPEPGAAPRPRARAGYRARAAVARALLGAALWWMLSEGAAAAWGVGLAVVALAVAASLVLAPPAPRPRAGLGRLLGFGAWFVYQSMRAGVQVAVLALRPDLRLAPGWIEPAVTLPAGPPRTVLINVLSLLPGTLCVSSRGDRLRIHVLDRRLPHAAAVQRTEQRVAHLFGIAA